MILRNTGKMTEHGINLVIFLMSVVKFSVGGPPVLYFLWQTVRALTGNHSENHFEFAADILALCRLFYTDLLTDLKC